MDIEGKFELNYPDTVKFSAMSPDLFHILGCKRVTTPWKHPPLYHDMPSFLPVDIHHWHQVYVYGDFIEQQFVGNSRAPLLNTFPLFNPQQVPPKEEEENPGGSFDMARAPLCHSPIQHSKMFQQKTWSTYS